MCPILEAPRMDGEPPKHGLYKKIQYTPRLTEERMALCSLVNRGIYGHVVTVRVEVGPMYILWLCIPEEYIPIYSLVTRNR
jgi:hypothetical protein